MNSLLCGRLFFVLVSMHDAYLLTIRYGGGVVRKKNRCLRKGLFTELPLDAAEGCAHVTLYGKSTVIIEGHCGICSMDESCICFNSVSGKIAVHGMRLGVKELSLDAAVVTGDLVESVAYEEGVVRGGALHGDDA